MVGILFLKNLLDQIWDPGLYEISEFELNLAGRDGDFLIADSANWVKESNLIIIQNCLNEIPVSKHEQILTNVMHIAGHNEIRCIDVNY